MAEEGELLIGKGDGNLHSVEPSGSLQNSHELQEPLKLGDAEQNDGCLLAKNIYIYIYTYAYIYMCVIYIYIMYHRARSRIFKN